MPKTYILTHLPTEFSSPPFHWPFQLSISPCTALLSHSIFSQNGQPHLFPASLVQGGTSTYSRSSHWQGQPRRALKREQCHSPLASTPISSALNPLAVGCRALLSVTHLLSQIPSPSSPLGPHNPLIGNTTLPIYHTVQGSTSPSRLLYLRPSFSLLISPSFHKLSHPTHTSLTIFEDDFSFTCSHL
jgi:hypothetical protein